MRGNELLVILEGKGESRPSQKIMVNINERLRLPNFNKFFSLKLLEECLIHEIYEHESNISR